MINRNQLIDFILWKDVYEIIQLETSSAPMTLDVRVSIRSHPNGLSNSISKKTAEIKSLYQTFSKNSK